MFVAEMRRVLRPGGIALVFEHNPLNPLTIRTVAKCEFDEHAVLLKSSMTEQLLTQAGFSGVMTRFIAVLPFVGPMARRIESIVSRIPIGAQYYTRGNT